MWTDGPTFDEPVYVMAGWSYLTQGEFSFNPEHPPLWKELAAVPLLFTGIQDEVLNPWSPANPVGADTIFRLARMPILFLFIVGGVVVYAWSRELWGKWAGLFSLTLYAFSPNVLAFAHLVTPDFPIACFYLIYLYALWKLCVKPSAARFVLAAFVLGLALASRFSGLLLVPVSVLALVYLNACGSQVAILPGGSDRGNRARRWGRSFLLPVGLLAAALPFVALTYGFVAIGNFVKGLGKFFEHATGTGHHAFLLGQYSTDGWLHYFPVAMALKTPIPTLVGLLALAVCAKRARGDGTAAAFLWLPAGLYLLAACLNKVNVGVRLVLPVYPLLFVGLGQLTTMPSMSKRAGRAVVALCLAWYIGGTLKSNPHHIAYFNEIVGPEKGYDYVCDSNIDWGQDLPRLARYLKWKEADGVLLAYYGIAPIEYFGTRAQYLPTGDPYKDTLAWKNSNGYFHEGEPRLLAISVTLLKGVPFDDHTIYRWLEHREPEARIGYSILVYDISSDADASRELVKVYEGCAPPEQESLRDAFTRYGPPMLAEKERELRSR